MTVEYVAVDETKDAPMPHHHAGLQWTATGYGSKIPSTRMVRIGKRWYRVYIVCYSNSGSAYIIRKGARQFVNID